MFYLTANLQRMEEFMHFKKILSASILASALIFCIPQAIYAAPDAKTETPVIYGWNSDALGPLFLIRT